MGNDEILVRVIGLDEFLNDLPPDLDNEDESLTNTPLSGGQVFGWRGDRDVMSRLAINEALRGINGVGWPGVSIWVRSNNKQTEFRLDRELATDATLRFMMDFALEVLKEK